MGRKPCCSKEEVSRGSWSYQEDQILINYINAHGQGKWRTLPLKAGLNRCGKSCRLRWLNYLRPDIKRGGISKEEEDLIIRLHALLGNRWSLIAGRLPGRTDNEIKNYWNTNLAKRQNIQKSTSTLSENLATKRSKKDQVAYNNNNPHIVWTKAIRHRNFNTKATTISSSTLETSNNQVGFGVDVDGDTGLGNHFGAEKEPSNAILVDANGIEIMMDEKVEEEMSNSAAQNMELDVMMELKRMASFLEVEDEWVL